ncbi:MAG: LLM class flavin-dependent oxidoreductase [Beijerinckiaceae bacterium]|jgi:N-acetyl-S-(2-succino)cysteine monooxygenase|nr:LLM class flavin-dependent oxidoreductase [Beijerinckiaceae bacterium]
MSAKHMHLGLFIRPCGHHIASWRHPQAHSDAGVNFDHFIEMAQTAERGLFDMLFSADSQTAWTGAEAHIDKVHYTAWLEPYTLLSALSAHTKNIGLVCTATTSFEQPFMIARKFATLDIISGGRAGWNVVTSGNDTEAQNFSKQPHLPKAERYRRGREFVDVVRALWDSWDEDAFIRDRQTGVFFDRSKMHVLNHHGDYYDVRGPLNVARTPQGQPVIVMAGLSEDGRALSAERAEVVFAAHDTIESAQEYYSDIKGRMAAFGRGKDELKILPGLSVIVAPTKSQAQAKFQELQELLHPDLGLALLSSRLGHDVTDYALDAPLPDLPENKVISSRSDMIKAWSRETDANGRFPTLRQLCQRFAAARGHYSIVGTPQMVVDEMERWFKNGACDGFNVVPSVYPVGLNDFVDLVVPELQRRGLYRTAYEGPTLRDVLGLSKPVSRHEKRPEAAE